MTMLHIVYVKYLCVLIKLILNTQTNMLDLDHDGTSHNIYELYINVFCLNLFLVFTIISFFFVINKRNEVTSHKQKGEENHKVYLTKQEPSKTKKVKA